MVDRGQAALFAYVNMIRYDPTLVALTTTFFALYNLEKNPDPSDIERTYNKRKQQTQFVQCESLFI